MVAEVSIRWHSRAGQGAITASAALAEILGSNGKFVQSFPDFGAEKRGAAVVVFNRIADKKIEDCSHPTAINAAVLLDPTLIASCEITPEELLGGLTQNGFLLVNSTQKNLQMDTGKAQVFSVPASEIAVAEIGKDIPNVPILGALVKILNIAKLESFQQELKKYLSAQLPAEIVAGNLRAFERGYLEAKRIEGGNNGKKISCAKPQNWQNIPAGAAIEKAGSAKHYSTGNWSRQTAKWDRKTCIDCKLCWPVCPHDAIKIKNGKMIGVDKSKCTACALCVAACPTKPKSLKIAPKKSSDI